AANFNEIELTRIAAPPKVLADYGITLLSAGDAINLKNSVPRERHVFSAGWSAGPWSLNLRQSYWGALERSGTVNIPPTTGPWAGLSEIHYDIGGLWTTDVNFSVDLSDRTRITLSGNNIFETRPDKTPEPLLSAYQLYSY